MLSGKWNRSRLLFLSISSEFLQLVVRPTSHSGGDGTSRIYFLPPSCSIPSPQRGAVTQELKICRLLILAGTGRAGFIFYPLPAHPVSTMGCRHPAVEDLLPSQSSHSCGDETSRIYFLPPSCSSLLHNEVPSPRRWRFAAFSTAPFLRGTGWAGFIFYPLPAHPISTMGCRHPGVEDLLGPIIAETGRGGF